MSAELLDRLAAALADLDPASGAPARLQRLVALGLDRLPLPGGGRTLQRWAALALVAEHDLSLAKLYEGHTDALAILAELGDPPLPGEGRTWGVWAAEPPDARAVIEAGSAGGAGGQGGAHGVRLSGRKAWCSGAASASDALLTAWHADGRGPVLVHVVLAQPQVEVSAAAWQAVGMAGSASLDVAFHGAAARQVGEAGAYLARPGFWQGGAGIAACWYGGARGLAAALHRASGKAEPGGFKLAALGKVDLALRGTAALLREAAAWIDAHPEDDAAEAATRVRLAAEQAAACVLDEAGRALGATPFCRDASFARAAADLPVFVRQSHGERDFASLGERVRAGEPAAWAL